MLRVQLRSTAILAVLMSCAVSEAQQSEKALPKTAKMRLEHAIGKWKFVTKIYNRSGEVTREVHGTDSNRYIIPGRVVEHTNEIPASKSISKGMMFYSFRDERFYMTSVDQDGNLWVLSGGLDKYVLTSRPQQRRDGSESIIRFVHENIQPDSFEAKMEFSRDGGKTWHIRSRQFLTRVKSTKVQLSEASCAGEASSER